MSGHRLSTFCLIAAAVTVIFTLLPPQAAIAPSFGRLFTPAPTAAVTGATQTATAQITPAQSSPPIPTLPPITPRDEILALQAENPDAAGRLTVPGTRIDYPVVYSTDPEYYLTHDFNKKESAKGAIFLDTALFPDRLTRHTLIHGHHMKDGSMFGDLSLYKDPDFLKAYPEILYETLYYELNFEIFSVYLADVSEKIPLSFKTNDAFIEYAQSVAARSLIPIETQIEFSESDVLLTLNTCTYEFEGAHLLVCARLRRDVLKE